MKSIGFTQGSASPCISYHKDLVMRFSVNDGDFAILGSRKDFDWFRYEIAGIGAVKFRGRLGPGGRTTNQSGY